VANTLLPPEERTLTPEEVGALDHRRYRGLMFLVVSVQFAIISAVLLLWLGGDLSYSPGWMHPITAYFIVAVLISITCGLTGMAMRRGNPEF
jgi:hypothetical protein